MAGSWTIMMHESNKKNGSENGFKTNEIWVHEHDLKTETVQKFCTQMGPTSHVWATGSPSFQNYCCVKFCYLKVHWSNFNFPKFHWKIMCFDQVSNCKLFNQNLSWNFCNNMQNCALYVGIWISKKNLAKILDSNIWFFLAYSI